jgi:hypothetical protein
VLPIQVAGQANAIGIVFRAVGMIYLVDLDDTPGNVMTLVTETPDTDQTSYSGFLSMFRPLHKRNLNEEQAPSEETRLL